MTAPSSLPNLAPWPTAYPRHRGVWTLKGGGGRWGTFDPATGAAHEVEPADDPALPALANALSAGTLIGYRAGRRAVVASGANYLKIVRPKRLDSLTLVHRWLTQSFDEAQTPTVLRTDTRGAVELSAVEGISLHQFLRTDAPEHALFSAIDDIAAMVAALHTVPDPGHLSTRSSDDTERWIETISRVDRDAARHLAPIVSRLPAPPEVDLSVTHGDLHDKNVFHHPQQVGLIDLDGVSLGAPEDDVANLAVHLQLRAMQGDRPREVGDRLASRLYNSYQGHRPLDIARLRCVEAHTWFRLACIYRFRTSSRHLVPELLRRAAARVT